MKEKQFILINRIIFLSLLLLNIFLPIILTSFQTELELVDSNLYCDYDKNTGYSNCEIELIFNKNISSGSVEVYFYDESDNLITSETAYFFETNSVVVDEITYINGNVSSYELDYLNFNAELEFLDFVYLFYYFIPVTILLFVQSLLLCYREYEHNGQTIEIYAGYYNHYIKVNSEKYDEHKTLVTFSPIVLSCTLESGDKIQSTISLTNRVSLKINDKLYTNKKC